MPADREEAARDMSELGPTRLDSIEIAENLTFSRREWRAQGIGAVLILVLLVVAAFGLFGVGPLSDTSAQSTDLRVDYPRFLRYRAPAVITLRVPANAVQGNLLEIWFDRSFLQEMRVEHVNPQPKDVAVGPERVTYTFELTERAASAVVVMHLQPERIGKLSGEVGIDGGSEVTIGQFVYP